MQIRAADGQITRLMKLNLDPNLVLGNMDITPGGDRIVYAVSTSHSDVWVIDNFDPAVKP